jgi:hypothetical protein
MKKGEVTYGEEEKWIDFSPERLKESSHSGDEDVVRMIWKRGCE